MGFSNEANEANEANTGQGGGGGGGGGGGFFPDRVDLPFVTAEDGSGTRLSLQRLGTTTYPEHAWAAEWYAYQVLDEFMTGTPNWRVTCNLLPATWNGNWSATNPTVATELADLVRNAEDERADALGEITAQSNGFGGYFLDLMSANSAYPATTKLLTVLNFVGGYVAMYVKGVRNRPRPSMLCPALLPPIPVPGHPSYPSGHSTQAHLMAAGLTGLVAGVPAMAGMDVALLALADRIARNRQLAGLHYQSDTDGGKLIAGVVAQALSALPAATRYQKLVTAATAEWTT